MIVRITIATRNNEPDPMDLFPDMSDSGMGSINAIDTDGNPVDLPEDITDALLKWAGYDTDDNETDDDTGTKKHISTFRVWKGSGTLRSGESYDVRGLNAETVMRREFGRSKNLSLMYDNNDTAQVAYALDDGNYSIMGYIREV